MVTLLARSTLIIMSGVAGSGKSTWANNYAKEHPSTLILSTDDIRAELFGTADPTSIPEREVKRELIKRAIEGSKVYSNVIIDSAVVKNKSIMRWWRKLNQYFDTYLLVIIDTPLEKCLEQNLKRDRNVPEGVIKEMYSFKEPLSEEIKEAFDMVLVVDSQNS